MTDTKLSQLHVREQSNKLSSVVRQGHPVARLEGPGRRSIQGGAWLKQLKETGEAPIPQVLQEASEITKV